jgi:hypothetical protein
MLGGLFIAFLKVSLCGFGGGIVWAHRIAVEQRRWISEEEFADVLSLCQFMPGPNVVGVAVCVGARLRGLAGAMAAVAGFLLIPWIIGFPGAVPSVRSSGCHSEILAELLRPRWTADRDRNQNGETAPTARRHGPPSWLCQVSHEPSVSHGAIHLAALGIAVAGMENMGTR